MQRYDDEEHFAGPYVFTVQHFFEFHFEQLKLVEVVEDGEAVYG